jgi:methylmalonyl-CoA mutase cobalamin-binding subunit
MFNDSGATGSKQLAALLADAGISVFLHREHSGLDDHRIGASTVAHSFPSEGYSKVVNAGAAPSSLQKAKAGNSHHVRVRVMDVQNRCKDLRKRSVLTFIKDIPSGVSHNP